MAGFAVRQVRIRREEARRPYLTQSEDTYEEVERLQIEAWRSWSPAEKFGRMVAMTRRLQEIQLAEIRRRHPDADDWELKMRLASRRLDPELMRRAFGWDPDVEGY
jgi:hypothetical protein